MKLVNLKYMQKEQEREGKFIKINQKYIPIHISSGVIQEFDNILSETEVTESEVCK